MSRRVVLALLAAFISISLVSHGPDGFSRGLRALTGGQEKESDIAQDIVGARALLDDSDPYPIIETAQRQQLGIEYGARHPSTHPPTAYLFALPLLGLDWPIAAALWAWFNIALLILGTWALGVRLRFALLSPIVWLLWPPAAHSLGQFTVLWFAAAALAWRWREHPAVGVLVGVVAATKLLPAVLLGWFLIRRDYRPVAIAGLTFGVLAIVVAVLHPEAWRAWLDGIGSMAEAQSARSDNGGLPAVATRIVGPGGAILVAAVVGLIAWRLRTWSGWLWASVALLSTGWIYTTMPLAALRLRGRASQVILAVSLLPPLLLPAGDHRMAWAIAGSIVAAGFAVVVDARPGNRDVGTPKTRTTIGLTRVHRDVKLPGDVRVSAASCS